MGEKMTWDEMKKRFPDEWLLITDFELDKFGKVVTGTVERHSKERERIDNPPIIDKDTAFRYTGKSTFMGLRSHATHYYAI